MGAHTAGQGSPLPQEASALHGPTQRGWRAGAGEEARPCFAQESSRPTSWSLASTHGGGGVCVTGPGGVGRTRGRGKSPQGGGQGSTPAPTGWEQSSHTQGVPRAPPAHAPGWVPVVAGSAPGHGQGTSEPATAQLQGRSRAPTPWSGVHGLPLRPCASPSLGSSRRLSRARVLSLPRPQPLPSHVPSWEPSATLGPSHP